VPTVRGGFFWGGGPGNPGGGGRRREGPDQAGDFFPRGSTFGNSNREGPKATIFLFGFLPHEARNPEVIFGERKVLFFRGFFGDEPTTTPPGGGWGGQGGSWGGPSTTLLALNGAGCLGFLGGAGGPGGLWGNAFKTRAGRGGGGKLFFRGGLGGGPAFRAGPTFLPATGGGAGGPGTFHPGARFGRHRFFPPRGQKGGGGFFFSFFLGEKTLVFSRGEWDPGHFAPCSGFGGAPIFFSR